ncbi:unnamed protein product, partial [Candidula unifasciata]
VLQKGAKEAPTKPKGRPKKDSVDGSADSEIEVDEESSCDIMHEDASEESPSSSTTPALDTECGQSSSLDASCDADSLYLTPNDQPEHPW